MSTGIINQWRIYCTTENEFVTGWLPDGETCTVCFNNNTHIINENSINIIQTISPNTTLISTQLPGQTNGNYRREGRFMNINAGPNVITKQITTFPYNIGMLAFIINIGTQNIGDEFDAVVMPKNQAPIGLLTENLVIGQTIIPIPHASLFYIQVGYQITLQSHTTGFLEEQDEILSIDKINNTVTLKTGITTAFNIGDYISFLMKRCKNIYLNTQGHIQMGNFLRASTFPITMQAEIRYKNNSDQSKVFSYASDYLF